MSDNDMKAPFPNNPGPIGLYIGNSPRITKIADDVDLKEGLVITNGLFNCDRKRLSLNF